MDRVLEKGRAIMGTDTEGNQCICYIYNQKLIEQLDKISVQVKP